MTGTQGLEEVARSTVFDREGEKVGKVEQIYISDDSGLPTWVSVKTGWFGSSTSLVPLASARHNGDRLDVAVDKDAIKHAPHLDAEEGISNAQSQELLRHYGVTAERSGWDERDRRPDQSNTTAGERLSSDAPRTPEPAAGPTAGGRPNTTTAPVPDVAPGGAPGQPSRIPASDAPTTPVAATERPGPAAPGDTDVSVVRSEERLDVGTERVAAGKARLRKYVVTEEQTVTVPVTREEVRIVREPIDPGQPVGDATIGEEAAEVTLHEDRVVANKETVPVERIGLAVDEVDDQRTVSDSVRKERIDTEGIDPRGRTPGGRETPGKG